MDPQRRPVAGAANPYSSRSARRAASHLEAVSVRQVRLVALVAENLRRYSTGLALLNVVDKE